MPYGIITENAKNDGTKITTPSRGNYQSGGIYFTTTIGDTEYTVIVKDSKTARETVIKKLERAILRDSLEGCHSKGENL